MGLRADAGIFVQASQADRHDRRIVGTDRMGVAAADRAERLDPAVTGVPDAYLVLTGRHREGSGGAQRGHRARRTRPALAPPAVAIEGAEERRRRGDLDRAAHAPPRECLEAVAHVGSPRTLPA